jgi:hypothetical protein
MCAESQNCENRDTRCWGTAPKAKPLLSNGSVAAIEVKSVPAEAIYREQSEVRVEASLNTSTVTLRVVGGKEKGIQCLGV